MPELSDERFSVLRDGDPERPDLPSTEVRRQGDGRRRRRTLATVAGSTLAVVLVVGGATAVTRGDRGAAPEPAPAPTTTSAPTLVPVPTTIPAGVPLDAALPETNLDGTPVEVTSSPGVDPLELCGTTLFDWAAALDVAGVSYNGGEDARGRTLLLFGSQQEASAILRSVRDAVTACPSSNDDIGTLLAEPVNSTLGEESVALLTQYENEGPLTGPTVHHLVRIGSSVLITSQAGEASNTREGLAAYADAATTAAEEVFDAITAPAGQSPGAEVTSDVTAEIPDGFPLDVDQVAMTADGGHKTGPAPDAPGVGELETCGAPLWSDAQASRLASNATGPEYEDARELRVFADATVAVAQMDAIRAAVEACPEEQSGSTTLARTIHTEDTGYSTFTFSTGLGEGLGGTIVQFVRVGNAVLATVLYGEFGPEVDQAAITQRTDISATIAPSLCIFTIAGC